MPTKLRAPLVLLSLAVFSLGCQQEEIQRYKASQPEFGEYGRYRILAAIFDLKDKSVFFKMSGQVEWVYEHKDEFKEFIESVSFKSRRTTWTLPDGWREERDPKSPRKAILMGHKDKTIELTVTELGPLGKGEHTILGNVNRWRGQLGLRPINDKELSQFCREVKAKEEKAIVVELTGPGARPAPPPSPKLPLEYKVPPGWEETQLAEFSMLTFQVADKGKKALITLSVIDGGTLEENVNRWLGQVDLPKVTQEQLNKEKKTIKLAGEDAWYFDLTGKETKPGRGDRIVGLMNPRGGKTLVVKMMGPAELVGQQKAAFEAFVGSIRFNVPGGEK